MIILDSMKLKTHSDYIMQSNENMESAMEYLRYRNVHSQLKVLKRADTMDNRIDRLRFAMASFGPAISRVFLDHRLADEKTR
jgi:hypothetical protein